MGNREALLAGAKRCLLEQGYEQTTARDIAAAAGVSLAAIGYHFGSKEALMTQALLLAFDDWERDFRHLLQTTLPANLTPAKRYRLVWERLMETFSTHRGLWRANMELFAQMDRKPEIRAALGNSMQIARQELAGLFLHRPPESVNLHTADTVGKLHHALLSGLLSLWLMQPETAMSAAELAEGLEATMASLAPTAAHARPKRSNVRKKTPASRA